MIKILSLSPPFGLGFANPGLVRVLQILEQAQIFATPKPSQETMKDKKWLRQKKNAWRHTKLDTPFA